MIEVTVKVPEDRVGDFYLMHGRWLQGLENRESGPPKVPEWSSDDSALAGSLWEKLPENARNMLDLLITEGDMDGRSIVDRLGMNDVTQLPGVHGWVGRVSNGFGRRNPIKARPTKSGTVWYVEPPVAALFRDVRGHMRPRPNTEISR
jgi:uncharacterized protein DUF6416